MFLTFFTLCAQGQTELNNSYSGSIDYLIYTHSTTLTNSNPDKSLGRKLGLGSERYSPVPIVTFNYSLSNLDQILKDHDLRTVFSQEFLKRPNGQQISVLDSMVILNRSYHHYRKNFSGSTTTGEEIDRLVHGYTRWSVLKSQNGKMGQDLLDHQIIELAKLTYPIDIELLRWEKENPGLLNPLGELMRHDSIFAVLFDQTVKNYMVQQNGCVPKKVNLRKYCGGDKHCEQQLETYVIATWIQDLFYSVSSTDGIRRLMLRGDSVTVSSFPSSSLSKFIECSTHGAVKVETNNPIDIHGGNILVADNFIIVGRDALEFRYLDTSCVNVQKRLNALSVPWKGTNRHQLQSLVTKKISENLSVYSNKSVFWFGLPEARPRYAEFTIDQACQANDNVPLNSGFSPFYHLDISLSLLGKLPDNDRDDQIYCLLSVPDMRYQRDNVAYKSVIENLEEITCQSFSRLKKEIQDTLGIELIPIVIPIPVILYGDNQSLEYIASFANGLVENTGNTIKYYAPDYSSVLRGRLNEIRYSKAKRDLRAVLHKHGIKLKFIKSSEYVGRSGLHCITKVVRKKE